MTLNQDTTRISYYLTVGDYKTVKTMISLFSNDYISLIKRQIQNQSKAELIDLLL